MAGASGDQEEARGNMVTSSGIDQYCYSETFHHQEMYNNMTTNMEMIGFASPSSKNHQQHSSSSSVLWNKQNNYQQNNFMVSSPDQFANSSSCVFPCEGNERPSQGLSLSLSSSNPSTIGLQSFELRSSIQAHDDLRFGPSSSRSVNIQSHHQPQGYDSNSLQIRLSRYMGPARELLNEFCNLGVKQNDHKFKAHKSSSELQDDEMKRQIYPLDLVELQGRIAKLLHMLEEVDRRYKHYCDQMKAVVSSFEAVAGNGAARVYSALASKAMSMHFRCLRDGIVTQIKDTKKAMGEKDTTNIAPGTTKGETPRLKLLDQTLRQQRALQQMTMMESHPWRPQRGLPERSVSVLRAWLFEHFLHPYPSDVDKHILARQTGLSRSQVSNWFINARVRLWKPMVEEMYMEELKDHDGVGAQDDATAAAPNLRNEDQKPTHEQLLQMDPECLSSIVNNQEKHDRDSYGAMELDFSSYNPAAGGAALSYGGGGVSLTLGLHQHGGSGGVSLAFTPTSQSSLFYPRGDQMEDCQTVPYSLLDSESQNLPYRNLMGAQLLHDFAG